MSQVLAFAAIVLVIAPAVAGLAIFLVFRLAERNVFVAVAVPYLVIVSLSLLATWALSLVLA